MSRADYAHWNEEADRVWWEEEGKHAESDAENARWERDNEDWEAHQDAADAFADDVAEMDVEEIKRTLADAVYLAKWPKAESILKRELEYRGES